MRHSLYLYENISSTKICTAQNVAILCEYYSGELQAITYSVTREKAPVNL